MPPPTFHIELPIPSCLVGWDLLERLDAFGQSLAEKFPAFGKQENIGSNVRITDAFGTEKVMRVADLQDDSLPETVETVAFWWGLGTGEHYFEVDLRFDRRAFLTRREIHASGGEASRERDRRNDR